MEPTVVLDDTGCFEMMMTMLETLNTVCTDELEAQGHTPECATMLLATMNTSAELMQVNYDLHEQMLDRMVGQVHLELVADDLGEEE